MNSLIGGRKRHSHFFWDRKRRSSQPWERGVHAKRKGNPSYKPVKKRTSSGLKKVYVLRKPSKLDKRRSKSRKNSRKHSKKH